MAKDPKLSLSAVKDEPGVRGLPKRARQAFAGAVVMERKGKHDSAEQWLDKAIKYEKEGK